MNVAQTPLTIDRFRPHHQHRLDKLKRDIASGMYIFTMLTPVIEEVAHNSPIYDGMIVINAGLIVACLLMNGFRFPILALKVASPFLLLVMLGVISASEKAQYYDIVRDVWYLMNPCIALVAGFMYGLMIKDFRRLLLCTFAVGIIFACVHGVRFVMDPSVGQESLRSIREDAGLGEFSSALCLGALFTLAWNKIPWRKISLPVCLAVLPLCGFSQVVGLSRIWWVCLIVLCFSATGFLHPRRVHVWVAPTLLGILLALMVPLLLPVSSIEGSGQPFEAQVKSAAQESQSPFDRFVEKVGNSLHEITPHEFTNMTDINTNWRGYESFRGMLYFRHGTWDQMAFGHGFGALTDIGILIKLKQFVYRVIPWFHNGYVFLLVKTGILGLVVYLSFVFILVRYGMQGYDNPSKVIACISRLLVGSALSLMLATAVFAGPFNRSRFLSAIVFMGAALALQRTLLARQAQLAPVAAGSWRRFGPVPTPAMMRHGAPSPVVRPESGALGGA